MARANNDEPDGFQRNLAGLLATAAGARSSDHLVVAGGGVQPLIDLMHRGFFNAVCAHPGHPLVRLKCGEGTMLKSVKLDVKALQSAA